MTNCTQLVSEAQAKRLIRQKLGRPYCPRCLRKHYITTLLDGRYCCARCRYKFSLKVLVGFKHTKLSYLKLLKLIDCFAATTTLKTAGSILSVSYPTMRFNYDKLRQLLPKTVWKVGGDIIVDECFVGKKKTGNQRMVAGAVNRAFTQVLLQPIPDREQHTLEQFLLDHVEIPSMVSTDAHPSYYEITWYGYGHEIDNHDQGQLKRTVPIERVWALFKTLIRRAYHHIWKESIEKYLVEFVARFNHRETVSNPLNLLAYLLLPCSKSLT